MATAKSVRRRSISQSACRLRWALLLCLFAVLLGGALGGIAGCVAPGVTVRQEASTGCIDITQLPDYQGDISIEINNNEPVFTDEELSRSLFEEYSELDELGRCGTAFALVGEELMPQGKRGDISDVHPSGWHQRFYDFVDQGALYNRSHLIAYKLAGENANERNLITGTRYFNAVGMAEYEDMVSDYVWRTGNHVLYRVTPIFYEDELVARGVHMEAQSVEDGGEGVSFNVYVYNVQPGVVIDYETGSNWMAEGEEVYYDENPPYKKDS